jgi:hypothetical protein
VERAACGQIPPHLLLRLVDCVQVRPTYHDITRPTQKCCPSGTPHNLKDKNPQTSNPRKLKKTHRYINIIPPSRPHSRAHPTPNDPILANWVHRTSQTSVPNKAVPLAARDVFHHFRDLRLRCRWCDPLSFHHSVCQFPRPSTFDIVVPTI